MSDRPVYLIIENTEDPTVGTDVILATLNPRQRDRMIGDLQSLAELVGEDRDRYERGTLLLGDTDFVAERIEAYRDELNAIETPYPSAETRRRLDHINNPEREDTQ